MAAVPRTQAPRIAATRKFMWLPVPKDVPAARTLFRAEVVVHVLGNSHRSDARLQGKAKSVCGAKTLYPPGLLGCNQRRWRYEYTEKA